jgi:hypothetical protein
MIYVSHSTSTNYRSFLYDPILLSDLSKIYKFVLPHNNKLNEAFKTKDFFVSGHCKLVIAEVSLPSTGQGIELGWAEIFKIPIVCFHKKDFSISSSLTFVSQNFIEYKDVDDMLCKLTVFIHAYYPQC